MTAPWEKKAHRLIALDAFASWKAANTLPNGMPRKRHRPYALTALSSELVECLGQNDEERAKALFLSYDGLRMLP